MPENRRRFLARLGALPLLVPRAQAPGIEVRPTALYSQPDGRANLVRITVAGLDAPAARARVTDRSGGLVGTAGLLPDENGRRFDGEVWVPLSQPSRYQVDVEVGRRRVARTTVRLTPPRRWTLFLLSTMHTDVGYTDLQEAALEVHRGNLDAALARLADHPDYRWTAECALQVLSYVEQRSPAAGQALIEAIRAGKVGFQALFANMLTGLLDHETAARLVWPTGEFARAHGLGFTSAQLTDVPGAPGTLPTLLVASGVRYLASGVNPDRALPLLPRDEALRHGLAGEWPAYPQLYWWEGPDGSRVLHWRAHHYGDAVKLGFADGADAMGRRLSDWLLAHPVLLAADYPADTALLYGIDPQDNAPMRETIVDNIAEFRRRYAYPRIVAGRAEDFFRDLEQRHGARLPVRRGDTGTYWEDGAAAAARELAQFREAQLAARAAELVALWDGLVEPPTQEGAIGIQRRSAERRAMWRDLLMFGEHTWGADVSVAAPESRQTVAQWAYKSRFLLGAAAVARSQVADGLLRIGRRTGTGRGRLVFNASSWPRTEVALIPGGAGAALSLEGRELPAVDLPGGDALVLTGEVPALGYVTLAERPRAPRPPVDDGAALEAAAGGFRARLDPATGAVASLVGPDGVELVRPSPWSGLNQIVYVLGGERSVLWTSGDRSTLTTPPQLDVRQAAGTDGMRRQRLPGIGVRLVATRRCAGLGPIVSTVTLYDALPWVDIENRLAKPETAQKEALYVAFPFAFTRPDVDLEVPLGRMRVERDQQPGACRDWYCHTHWVHLTEGARGVLWSGRDTPLVTLNDLFRGAWRRRIEPDGTLFAWALHNYWHTNYPGSQGGDFVLRFRLSLLPPGDAAEPVRRGWAACEPPYVSAPFDNTATGPLLARDRALVLSDPGAMVIGAKPADDGEGTILKVLDVGGAARRISVWPAAHRFQLARRCDLVEMNGDPLPVTADGRAALDLPAWGVAAARLFTPRERAG
jgi:hypothetical protein